jgi:hypothetical protein
VAAANMEGSADGSTLVLGFHDRFCLTYCGLRLPPKNSEGLSNFMIGVLFCSVLFGAGVCIL